MMIINTKYHIAEKHKRPYKELKLTFVGKALVSLGITLFAAFLIGARSAPAEKISMQVLPIQPAILGVDYVKHKVKQGECISDVAELYRSKWHAYAPAWVVEEAIKEHNAAKLYKGYILHAGDTIEVPIWIKHAGGDEY